MSYTSLSKLVSVLTYRPGVVNDADDNTADADSLDDTKKPVPAHVTVVKEVMLRCKHIISSRNPRLRLLVLDTIRQTCTALKQHQCKICHVLNHNLCMADLY